jgi:hypothetical protein
MFDIGVASIKREATNPPQYEVNIVSAIEKGGTVGSDGRIFAEATIDQNIAAGSESQIATFGRNSLGSGLGGAIWRWESHKSPVSLFPLRAGVVLEHQPSAIDGGVLLAVPPVRIDALELPAASALLLMPVVTFVIRIHGAATTIAPNNVQVRCLA